MTDHDIRWKQRFSNYLRAFDRLSQAVTLSQERALTDLEKQGLIQAFEFTHELAWNVMQDYFVYQGNTEISGARDATREAFSAGIIEDGDNWMEMIKSRNMSSHTYNEATETEISMKILTTYFELLIAFKDKMNSLIDQK